MHRLKYQQIHKKVSLLKAAMGCNGEIWIVRMRNKHEIHNGVLFPKSEPVTSHGSPIQAQNDLPKTQFLNTFLKLVRFEPFEADRSEGYVLIGVRGVC